MFENQAGTMNATVYSGKPAHRLRHRGDDDDDDYFSHSKYYPRQGNSSITASVTIHVTPEHYHLINWSLLWTGFILAVALASYQVHQENKWFAARKREEHQAASEGEGTISSADWTRNRFRRLLLIALTARFIMIPVQLWSEPIWAQFVADTLPDMAFASAWTLLVSFFVQLVALATGTGTATSPGWVIQITAYSLYMAVLGTYFWNPVASVLLYALLFCIYAALFGTTLYFCPRLLLLLHPSLSQHSAVAVRLSVCSILCVVVLGFQTFGFARKVLAPPENVSWWWQYGTLELIPAVLFLLMINPRSVTSGSNVDDSDESSKEHRRTRSSSPGSLTPPTPGGSRGGRPLSSEDLWRRETTPLLRPGAMSGAAASSTTGTIGEMS